MATKQNNLADIETKQADQQAVGKAVKFSYHLLGKFSWQGWALIFILVFGAVGFTATSMLLNLPKTPQCARIFWPFASASMRLYCAQLEAEQGTVDSLLKAINLVESLPKEHPLRAEIDRSIEEWALAILAIAEEKFQAGNLENAIAIAQKIPDNVQAYNLVEKRVDRWQSIWQEGETIFAEVERQLRDSNWTQAFREAVKLLNLPNEYWATIKYDETTKKIQLAREESDKLDDAYAILRRGGLDNWLKAMAEAAKISSSSYAYQEAQNLISKAKEKLVAYVDELIDNRSWQAVLDVVDRVPEALALRETSDWKTLASAGLDASEGSVESLDMAIAALEKMTDSSPFYQDAQDLIARWKLEKEDVVHLAKARDLAGGGTIENFNAAIAQAQLIPNANPRHSEAQREINDWTSQIQTIEDQPLLDRSRETAGSGTVADLQTAIAQASLINPSRALYKEAQQEIRQWNNSIEQQQDQPLLDQAIALGSAREYTAAIDTAQQIRRGRALYQDAQSNIRRWGREIQAQKKLQEAYLVAQTKTPEAIISAINILQRIPSSTEAKSQSLAILNRLSYQLLTLAQDRANAAFIQDAIKLAGMIPHESSAYESAKAQIAVWRQASEPTVSSPSALPVTETNEP